MDSRQESNAPPRWQRRPNARPEEILQAALALFVERGYAATRLEAVAERAGVSKGTLYLYFTSKEALFQAAVRENITPLIESAEQRVSQHHGSPLVLLSTLFRRWAEVLMDPILGGLCKLVIAEAGNFPDTARFYVEEVVLRARRVFQQVVERAIAAGEMRALPPELIVRELMTPILFLSLWRHSLAIYDPNPADPQQFLSVHWDVVMHGLRPATTT